MSYCLIVEDNSLSSSIMQNLLTKLGYASRACSNGGEALSICGNEMPKLIMLDGYMPEMDGLEFLHHFKKIEGHETAYIVFCSSSLDRPDIEKALATGAHCHFPKPLSQSQLRQCLDEACNHNGFMACRECTHKARDRDEPCCMQRQSPKISNS